MRVKRSSKKVKLQGESIRSLEEFYSAISERLRFPEYFGRNLDALWDMLATDVKGPVELTWEDSEISKKSMGKDFEKIAALLKEVERERDDFTVAFR